MDQNPESQSQNPTPAPSANPTPVASTPAPTYAAPAASGNGNGFAITALVLGIIAFLFGWLWFLNPVTAIAAIIFSVVAMKKNQSKGMWITGLVLGAIGLLTSLVLLVVFFIALGANPDALNDTSSSSDSSMFSE